MFLFFTMAFNAYANEGKVFFTCNFKSKTTDIVDVFIVKNGIVKNKFLNEVLFSGSKENEILIQENSSGMLDGNKVVRMENTIVFSNSNAKKIRTVIVTDRVTRKRKVNNFIYNGNCNFKF